MSAPSTSAKTTRGAKQVKKAAAAPKSSGIKSEYATGLGPSFHRKMAKALKDSVNSSLGFVVPKLTGEEALAFMRSVGGFSLPSRPKTAAKTQRTASKPRKRT